MEEKKGEEREKEGKGGRKHRKLRQKPNMRNVGRKDGRRKGKEERGEMKGRKRGGSEEMWEECSTGSSKLFLLAWCHQPAFSRCEVDRPSLETQKAPRH